MEERFTVLEAKESLHHTCIHDRATGIYLDVVAPWSVAERNRYTHMIAEMLNAQEKMEDDLK